MNTPPPPHIHIFPYNGTLTSFICSPPPIFRCLFLFGLLAPSPLHHPSGHSKHRTTNPHLNPSFPEELWVNKSFLEKTLWTELWSVFKAGAFEIDFCCR